MSVVLTRVDNRLIHGQILEAWLPHVHADHIIVVEDSVANDPFQCQLMAAVVPSTIKVDICSHQQFAELWQSGSIDNDKLLLLFANPASALLAYRDGCHFATLNLGNMHVGAQKCCISKTLYMDDDDLQTLEELSNLGVDVSAQCIPTDRALAWDCHCNGLR